MSDFLTEPWSVIQELLSDPEEVERMAQLALARIVREQPGIGMERGAIMAAYEVGMLGSNGEAVLRHAHEGALKAAMDPLILDEAWEETESKRYAFRAEFESKYPGVLDSLTKLVRTSNGELSIGKEPVEGEVVDDKKEKS